MTTPTRGSYSASRFNVHSRAESGEMLLYNTRNGALCEIPNEYEASVKAILKGSDGDPDLITALSENGFLISSGVDENVLSNEMYHSARQPSELHLIVMPTEDCNFRCVYCYESFELKEMQEGTMNGIVKFIENNLYLKTLRISWFGGEPMYAKNVIYSLSERLIKVCEERGIAYSASMTTNAFLIDHEAFEKLIACRVINYQVTLDGLKESHDSKRVQKDGSGSFDVIIQNLKGMRDTKLDFTVTLRVHFDQDNYLTTADLTNYLSQEFGNDGRFQVYYKAVGQWGGKNDDNLNVCDDKQAIELTLKNYVHATKSGLPTPFLESTMKQEGFVCYAAKPNSFLIRSNGRLGKCTVALEDESNDIGFLTDTGQMIINERKLHAWVGEDEQSDKVCQSCFFRPACQGAACPLIKIRTGERPCPTEKIYIKKVVQAFWEARN
jgi:uncharacterized protein